LDVSELPRTTSAFCDAMMYVSSVLYDIFDFVLDI
jgi:hypothetical protein